MADDLGWKDLHCYGNELVDTVNLDRLAEQGMRFTDGYAASPVCTPTRAAMMTGMSPARLAITNHAPGNGEKFSLPGSALQEAPWNTFLGLEHVTIAERLREAGYATGFVGKWHLSHRPGQDENGKLEPRLRPEHQGFDINIGGGPNGGPPSYFSPYKIPALKDGRKGEFLPERLADECIKFVKENKDKPFFLTWWDYSVHYPFQAPEELIEKYKKRIGSEKANPTYAAMIEGIDLAIGRFLAALDAEGLAENTIVIFTSDNGAFQADISPLRREKGYLYEGGIRVPWIVRWPGHVKSGSTCTTPIISTDTFPTLLEVAGLKADSDRPLDGVSLVPLLEQTGELDRDSIFFHYPNYAFHKKNRLGSAIREGQHKLIHHYDDDSVELYDLEDDISEARNLALDQPELASRLRGKLDKWLLEAGANTPVRFTAYNGQKELARSADTAAQILFTTQGKTARINLDGSGLKYFDFSVPNQATWQPSDIFSDGHRILFLSMEPRRDGPGKSFDEYYTQTPTHLWIHDLRNEELKEICNQNRLAVFVTPALLMNSDRMLIQVVKDRVGQIYSVRLDGSDPREFTRSGEGLPYGLSLSPDGSRVAFHLASPAGYQVWTSDLEGKNRQLIAADPEHLYFGTAWSPDGKWILYADCLYRNDAGHDWADVCVGKADGSQHKVLTKDQAMWFAATYGDPDTRGGGSNVPSWTNDGKILFPRRHPGSKVAWEYQSNRADVDHFNREFKPEEARGGTEICRLDPNTGSIEVLTPNEPGVWDFRAIASPDGKQIAFCRALTGKPPALYIVDSDGKNVRRLSSGWNDRGADHPKWLAPR